MQPRNETDDLRSQARHLNAEVLRLQRRLDEAHAGGDSDSIRRAYTALVQHVTALQQEAQMSNAHGLRRLQAVGDHIRAFDVQVASPEEVADELGNIGLAVAAVLVLTKAVKGTSLAPLRVYLWAAGSAFVTWRITSTTVRRLGSLMFRNKSRKRQLLREWDTMSERLRIMEALTHWEGGDPTSTAAAGRGNGSSPDSSDAGGSVGWVDVPPGGSSPARHDLGPVGGDGSVAYPQVYKGPVSEGNVQYPSVGKAKPSAPPLPKAGGGSDAIDAQLEELRRKAGLKR